MAMNFVVCLNKANLGDFSGDDLTVGRLYEVVAPADEHGMLRVIDDSGEDFLYPASCFEGIAIPDPVAGRLHEALAQAA